MEDIIGRKFYERQFCRRHGRRISSLPFTLHPREAAVSLFPVPDNFPVPQPVNYPLSTLKVNLLFSITLRLSSTATSVHYPRIIPLSHLEDRASRPKGNEIVVRRLLLLLLLLRHVI